MAQSMIAKALTVTTHTHRSRDGNTVTGSARYKPADGMRQPLYNASGQIAAVDGANLRDRKSGYILQLDVAS